MKERLIQNLNEIEIVEVSSAGEVDDDVDYRKMKKSLQKTIDEKIKKSMIDSLYPNEEVELEIYRDDADDCAELLTNWTTKSNKYFSKQKPLKIA